MLELPRKSNSVHFPELLALSIQLPENISKCDQLGSREMPCFCGDWSLGREDRNNRTVLFGNYLYCAHKWTTLCWCCVRQSSGNQVGVQTFLLPYKQSVLHNWTYLSAVRDVFSISVIVSVLSYMSAHPALAVFSRTCPSWASIPSLHYMLLLSTGCPGVAMSPSHQQHQTQLPIVRPQLAAAPCVANLTSPGGLNCSILPDYLTLDSFVRCLC